MTTFYDIEQVTSPATTTVDVPWSSPGELNMMKLTSTRSLVWDQYHAAVVTHTDPLNLFIGDYVTLFADLPAGYKAGYFTYMALTPAGKIFASAGYFTDPGDVQQNAFVAQLLTRSGDSLSVASSTVQSGMFLTAQPCIPTEGRFFAQYVGEYGLYSYDGAGLSALLDSGVTGGNAWVSVCSIDATHALVWEQFSGGRLAIVDLTGDVVSFVATRTTSTDVGLQYTNSPFIRQESTHANRVREYVSLYPSLTPAGWEMVEYELDTTTPAINLLDQIESPYPPPDGLGGLSEIDGVTALGIDTSNEVVVLRGASVVWTFDFNAPRSSPERFIAPPLGLGGVNIANSLVLLAGARSGVGKVELFRIVATSSTPPSLAAGGLQWGWPLG